MISERDPSFLRDKLNRLEKVRRTSTSPSELERVERCIKKTRKRLKLAKRTKKGEE